MEPATVAAAMARDLELATVAIAPPPRVAVASAAPSAGLAATPPSVPAL